MINTHSVIVLLIVEAAMLAFALALLVGHGAYVAWRSRRLAPRLALARRGLCEALEAGADARAAEALSMRLPFAMKVVLIGELSPQLTGSRRLLLTRAADEAGLLARAAARCTSRSWRRRLRGARLFTLLGGGDAVLPRLFDDRRAEVRAQAAEWAGGHPEEDATIARLVALLGDEHPLCRFTVEDALVRLGSAAIVPLAEHLLTARGDPARRAL
ncbi:MAG: hypothetical protein QOE11_3137, partial [Solirubrobacteraceae bacterium]|nr:hypothetical protein [Solirubrobacteraceae bacterium]